MNRTLTGLGLARYALALCPLTLAGCQSIGISHVFSPAYTHGKVALCSSAASIGPAALVVTDTDSDHPGVQTVPRGTPPEGVCAALNKAAIDAGFQTVFDDKRNDAGVQIMARDPDRIKIDYKNVRIVVQEF